MGQYKEAFEELRKLVGKYFDEKEDKMADARIDVDQDRACRECGQIGATQNGLCMECTTRKVVEEGPNVNLLAPAREIKTAVAYDSDNNQLLVKLSLIAPATSEEIKEIHSLLASGTGLKVTISSPQKRMF